MGQRVTIQYSIDVDNLPNEVKRLMEDVNSQICELREQDVKWAADLLTPAASELIKETREKLSAIDHTLQDVDTIITGYLQYKFAPPSPTEQPQQTLPAEEIQERLSEFREKIRMTQNENEVAD